MKSVAISMKRKFDKYWGKVEDINKLLLIAIVLDPRYKMEYLLFSLSDIESNPSKVNELRNQVKDFLIHMYDVYKVADPLAAHGYNNSNLERIGDTVMVNDEDDVEAERLSKFMKLRQVMDVVEIRNEVDKYLLEPPENLRNPNFDLLAWWQENSPRFPIVSQIAKDVFGIPISTVASESAFSLGGRIVDHFRASLTPRMVEALVCTSD
ncbi:unnamed protein product, partial [Prunus brigantina]